MTSWRLPLSGLFLSMVCGVAPAQQVAPAPAPGDPDPIFRLEAGGPTAYVTALAFGPDGRTLYAAGWDKVVRVWTLNNEGKFVLDSVAYRVPIAPGLYGAINAIAVSPDGTWLAVGGLGVFRGVAGFRQKGLVWPTDSAMTPAMRRDQGMIYVFNTRTGAVRLLEGHLGAVHTLAFAPEREGKPPLLVSAARPWNEKTGKFVGALRLWDVAAGTSLAGEWNFPDPQTRRPGLTAWHTGAQPRQLRVAFAWGDGFLRVWDAEHDDGAGVRQVPDLNSTIAVAQLPGSAATARLVTAGYGIGEARLRLWNVPAGQVPRAPAPAAVDGNAVDTFPRALALFPSKPGGEPNLAAVVNQVKRLTGVRYDLQLLERGRDDWIVRAKVENVLAQGGVKQPALAAAPDGRHLAVAGSQGHEIMIYTVADLLKQRGGPQILNSAGAPMYYVAFVRKDKDVGLVLNEHEKARKAPGKEPRPPAGEDLIFDFTKRRLTGDHKGWSVETVAAGDWLALADGKTAIVVKDGVKQVQRIELPPNYEITDFALLPPKLAAPAPILAVASHLLGQPGLWLYNAQTGDKLRHYTGHAGPIHGLAFSADGRLLASAAEDQTVCVWTLTDLNQVLDKVGLLPGVAVQPGKGGVEVTRVQEDSPAHLRLKPGDLLEGVAEGDKRTPLARPLEFFEAISLIRPGKHITLHGRRAGKPLEVPLQVKQGVDDRKPLFQLFVARGADRGTKPADREWIGWNRLAPYESSGLKADRHLGWHFNTGKRESPTSFAPGNKYRAKFHREGLLQHLITRGNDDSFPDPKPLPKPELGLVPIEEGGRIPQRDANLDYLVRRAKVELKLQIGKRPLDTIKTITYKLKGGEEKVVDLSQAKDEILTIPLQPLPRGRHSFEVTVKTRDDPPQEVADTLVLRYQPTAPEIKYKGQHTLLVDDADFSLKAEVHPGLAGEGVRVVLTHWHEDKEKLKEDTTPRVPLKIDRPIKLGLGVNLIKVEASNRDALSGYEDFEKSDPLSLKIIYADRGTPVIALKAVEAPASGGEQPQQLQVEPRKPVRVNGPRIHVVGTISATDNLRTAEWSQGATPDFIPLAADLATKPRKELAIRQELTLKKPGAHEVRFRASTSKTARAEEVLRVDYQPRVPVVEIGVPAGRATVIGDADVGELEVYARLRFPDDRHPFQATILVNERPTPGVLKIDDATGEATARVPLQPGDNRIQVKLTNEWGANFVSDAVLVRYARPPRVLDLVGPPQKNRPAIDLVARVRSALPLDPKSLEVKVNGNLQAVQADIKPEAGKIWVVSIKEVPLSAAAVENKVEVSVSNPEGRSLQRALTLGALPAGLVPVITWLEPMQNDTVHKAELKVRFLVTSSSKLKRVHLVVEGQEPIPVAVSGQRLGKDGKFELKAEKSVRLQPDLNTMHVNATNEEGGEPSSAKRVMTYLPRPVTLVIEKLIPADAKGNFRADEKGIAPEPLPGRRLVFHEVPNGRVRLVGRVDWPEEDDEFRHPRHRVRIFVNGFQQLGARLEPAAGKALERKFQADLVLNRRADNHVVIDLPGLKLAEGSRPDFRVTTCLKPVENQRLHLLVLSVEEKDQHLLKDQVLKAFQTPAPKGPAFASVHPYPLLSGYDLRPQYVFNQLLQIRINIGNLAVTGDNNDVVVIYYRGDETVDARGNYLQTGQRGGKPSGREMALACDDLVSRFFDDAPGAHLLMLDVGRTAALTPDARDKLLDFGQEFPRAASHVAVLRYAWLGPSGPPRDARLISALEEVMPKSSELNDVTSRLRNHPALLKHAKLLSFHPHVSGDLGRLVMRR